ncbi:hypothetical protein F4561_005455 [Lipingzhangella halophila]|uniref:Immunity protein 51 of polymorphic toxin system n=1 Tax=Lipingzhangella halophila TaxID=1783352 RepID=A0A7W7W693_9ACTN|nr:Imm51 family immunity protein [Lipingzhangella halophila]MBB4934635.1 hypothetical protein [Lipingzhangella halophila]
MIDDSDTFAPFGLYEDDDDPGRFCLMMPDLDMEKVEDIFRAEGVIGNGHGWGAVAESAARRRLPEIAGALESDPESGTFVVDSLDLGALRRLAELPQRAYHDRELLTTLVREADPAPDLLY